MSIHFLTAALGFLLPSTDPNDLAFLLTGFKPF